jgi:hypothetical protein
VSTNFGKLITILATTICVNILPIHVNNRHWTSGFQVELIRYNKTQMPSAFHHLFTQNWTPTPWIEAGSSEANSHQDSQEIPLLQNPKVHYRFHKSPRLVPIWVRWIQFPHSHTISIRSIIILSSYLRLGLQRGLFPSGFPIKILYAFLTSPVRATGPTHLTLLNLFILITWNVQVIRINHRIRNCDFIRSQRSIS